MDVWIEGFRATGEIGSARKLCTVNSDTLREACDKYALEHPDWAEHYDPERLTYWGCRIFDNEADARSQFG